MASMDVSVDPLPEDMSMQLSNEHLEDAMSHTPKGRLFSFLSHSRLISPFCLLSSFTLSLAHFLNVSHLLIPYFNLKNSSLMAKSIRKLLFL